MGRNKTIFRYYVDVGILYDNHGYHCCNTARDTRNTYDVYDSQYCSLNIQFCPGDILLDETKKLNSKIL